MFDHIGIFVSDTGRSFPFFEKALAPLRIVVRERQRSWGSMVMSSDEWPPFLWIGPAGGEYHGTPVPVSERRPMHLAFKAPSKSAVEEFYRLGLENGGRDNGAPDVCGKGVYGAFLLDPDGNNVEAIYREKL
jgi:catechol 2,3-dioxygenase-like lactoylglutathione lyase family enzyme